MLQEWSYNKHVFPALRWSCTKYERLTNIIIEKWYLRFSNIITMIWWFIHQKCVCAMHLHAIFIITSSFTPRSAHSPLVPSRGKFNPAIGQIYPHTTFTPLVMHTGYFVFQIYPHDTSGVCPNLRLVHTAPGIHILRFSSFKNFHNNHLIMLLWWWNMFVFTQLLLDIAISGYY